MPGSEQSCLSWNAWKIFGSINAGISAMASLVSSVRESAKAQPCMAAGDKRDVTRLVGSSSALIPRCGWIAPHPQLCRCSALGSFGLELTPVARCH